MTEKSRRTASHRGAVERVREAESFTVNLPVGRIGGFQVKRSGVIRLSDVIAAVARADRFDGYLEFLLQMTRLISVVVRDRTRGRR
jgi:hypothetical protein